MSNILHIGLPKTATSTLQRYVFPILQEKEMVIFNEKEVTQLTRKHLALGLSSEERIKLSNLLSRGKNLISDESLVGRDPHDWKERAERLNEVYGKETIIVITVRDLKSLFTSYYIQALQENNIVEPEDFFVTASEYENIKKICSYPYINRVLDVDTFDIQKLYECYTEKFKKVYLVDIKEINKFNFLSENMTISEDILSQISNQFSKVNDNISYSKLGVELTLRRERILRALNLQSFSPVSSISPKEMLAHQSDQNFSINIKQSVILRVISKILLLHWRRFVQGTINKYFRNEKYSLPLSIYLNDNLIEKNNTFIKNHLPRIQNDTKA